MTVFDIACTYCGAILLVLTFLYGIKDYLFTIFAGFAAFCVFYFSFGVADFEWSLPSILPIFKDAAIIYGISFIIGLIIYKILPLKQIPKATA